MTAQLLLLAIVIGGIVGGGYYLNKKNPHAFVTPSSGNDGAEWDSTINIGVNTWGGFAGGQYFNEGFLFSEKSRYWKEYGLKVNFKLIDDFQASRDAFKAGEIDMLWGTMDSYPCESEGLSSIDSRAFFQPDWSRGGDAIVARRGINSISDLKKKNGEKLKISVAPMTPSHTLLLHTFTASQISKNDVEIIEVESAINSADLFKKGQVDLSVVWSPDDMDCIASVSGSKILVNTNTASKTIADVFFAKESFIKAHPQALHDLLEGWFIGAGEINASDENKQKAAQILSEGLNQPKDFCYGAINNTRLCTFGDNANFFNINGDATGVTGDDLYSRMTIMYGDAGYLVQSKTPPYRSIVDISILKMFNSDFASRTDQLKEGEVKFTKVTAKEKNQDALSTKQITITFPTGSYALDENSKYIIDKEFVSIANSFEHARIRIEGNTDNVGDPSANNALSMKRAKSVEAYLISEYHWDPNRIVTVGNGDSKPVEDNSTENGREKNRRTDFQLLPQ